MKRFIPMILLYGISSPSFSISLGDIQIVTPAVENPRTRMPAVIQAEKQVRAVRSSSCKSSTSVSKDFQKLMFPNLAVKKPKFTKRGNSVIFELPHRISTSCFDPDFSNSKITDDIYREAQAFRLVVGN